MTWSWIGVLALAGAMFLVPAPAPKAAMSCTGGQWVQVGQSYYDGFCATYLQDNGCTHCVTTVPPILPP
jgi:hypothetical protein